MVASRFRVVFLRLWAVSPRVWRVFHGCAPNGRAPTTERFVTMFEEAASLAEVDRWLRHLDHRKHEQKAAEHSQLAILLAVLRQDLLPNEILVDRVDSEGLWLKDRNGVNINWSSMSDGYRSALALVADILRHLISAYGHEDLWEEALDGVKIKRSGVIMIDEIDAHLHPEWQRDIGFWLTKVFPNVQFLVTTHSPLICQAASEQGIFVLPEPGSGAEPRALPEEDYKKVIASTPDTILRTPAFGLANTRSPRAVEARKDLSALNAKKRGGGRLTPKEQAQYQQLELFQNYGNPE
jgi:AAA domain, putative AbiEii toxin, Type IV TA system